MIQFLQQYWRLILEGCFALFTLVFFILKKKPTTDILSMIYEICIKAVNETEDADLLQHEKKSRGLGSDVKLERAVSSVNAVLKYIFPDIDVEKYHSFIVNAIENILTTPQKKSK